MKLVIVLVACAIGSAGVACAACQATPFPPPVTLDAGAVGDAPPPLAGDGGPILDDCQLGCAALMAVSCPLGDGGTDCAGYLRTLNETGKEAVPGTREPLRCSTIKAIKTKQDAQKLGFACP